MYSWIGLGLTWVLSGYMREQQMLFEIGQCGTVFRHGDISTRLRICVHQCVFR